MHSQTLQSDIKNGREKSRLLQFLIHLTARPRI
jgi:hypothetical protein